MKIADYQMGVVMMLNDIIIGVIGGLISGLILSIIQGFSQFKSDFEQDKDNFSKHITFIRNELDYLLQLNNRNEDINSPMNLKDLKALLERLPVRKTFIKERLTEEAYDSLIEINEYLNHLKAIIDSKNHDLTPNKIRQIKSQLLKYNLQVLELELN